MQWESARECQRKTLAEHAASMFFCVVHEVAYIFRLLLTIHEEPIGQTKVSTPQAETQQQYRS